MGWDLEIVFSGLCMFYLPDNKKDPQVLLVDARSHHGHMPLLSFNPSDLDDLCVDLGSLAPYFHFVVSEKADHLAEVSLVEKEIVLRLEPPDNKKGLVYRNDTGAKGAKPHGLFPQRRERDLRWIAPIHDLFETPPQIDPGCLGSFGDAVKAGVISRIKLDHGEIETYRISRRADDYRLWEFYPDKTGSKEAVVRTLADQVVVRLSGLRDMVTVSVLDKTSQEEFYLKFPSNLKAKKVRLGISNLPQSSQPLADEFLVHFHSFFDLFDMSGHGHHADHPMPRPRTGRDFLGGSGGGQQQFCPCATCK